MNKDEHFMGFGSVDWNYAHVNEIISCTSESKWTGNGAKKLQVLTEKTKNSCTQWGAFGIPIECIKNVWIRFYGKFQSYLETIFFLKMYDPKICFCHYPPPVSHLQVIVSNFLSAGELAKGSSYLTHPYLKRQTNYRQITIFP